MKLKGKYFLILGSFTLLIVIIVGINLFNYKNMESDSHFINLAGSLQAKSFRMAHLSSEINMNKLMNKDMDKDSILKLQDGMSSFEQVITALIYGDNNLDLKPLNDGTIKEQLINIHNQWIETYKPNYEKVINDGDSEANKIIGTTIEEYVKQINETVKAFSHSSHEKVVTAEVLSIILFIISIIFIIIALIIIEKIFLKPINMISYDLEAIASGEADLTQVVHFKSNDEMGKLTKYFNQFISKIKEIVKLITNTSHTITSSIEVISTTSEEVLKSTDNIGIAVEEVSIGSLEQSEMVNQLTEIVSKANDNIKTVITKAQELERKASDTKEAAIDGEIAIKHQDKDLQLIVSHTQHVSKAVNELEKNSQDIRNVMDIIDTISNQTNLLALNASIEAARAGVAGQGFSVVAEEIRKLAEETAKSTGVIVDIVDNITGQTTHVKTYMDGMVDKINHQARNSDSVQLSLDRIVQNANLTYDEVKEIKGINEKLSTTFTIINNTTKKIMAVVKNNSLQAQEVSASIEEHTASFEEISANINALNSLTNELTNIISRFKI